jgi:hypothetical protein
VVRIGIVGGCLLLAQERTRGQSVSVRGDDGDDAADLEAIDLLAQAPTNRASVARGAAKRPDHRRMVAAIVAIAVALIIGGSVGMRFGGRTRQPSPARAESTPNGSAGTTAETTALTTLPESTLRVLFSHGSPRGSVVVARAGAVPTAESHICGLGVPVTPNDDLTCRTGREPGLRFDFSAPGSPWYRLTVLNADLGGFPNPVALEPVSLASAIRLVHADGSTTPLNAFVRVQLAAFRSNGVARVRVHLAKGGTEEMAPVDGWAAFAEDGSDTQQPFGIRVEGLDKQGRVVATAVPFRCC